MEFLGYIVTDILRDCQNAFYILHSTYIPYIPTAAYEGSSFSTSLTTLVIVCLTGLSQPVLVKWYLTVVSISFL